MEYVRRESFQTWFADVGVIYVVVTLFVTAAMLFGSLASFIGSSTGRPITSPERAEVQYPGPPAQGMPTPYP